jgi:hypothetical protein
MAEHRVPMLSPALHRQPDPEHSRDPRIRALVGQLRTVEVPGPRPEFRDELRTQLVAITPRVVAEGDAPAVSKRRPSPVPAAAPAASKSPGRFRTGVAGLRHVRIGRPLAVLTCVVAVFAVLLGGAVWISKRALPGDALYGLKRASENVQEAMTSGDSARAKLLLDFAANRYDEVSDLLPKSGSAVEDHTGSLVTSTFNSADSDVKQAMQALGAQAIRNRSGSGLGLMTGWAAGPQRQLRDIMSGIPAGAVHQRAASSLALLNAADRRAAALKALGACDCLAHARTDDLGAVPCTKCASAAAPAVGGSTSTSSNAPAGMQRQGAGTTTHARASASGSAHISPGSGTTTSQGPAGSATGSTLSDAPAVPGLPGLPTVTNVLPSGTCAGLDLGLLSVGRCGVGLGGQ